MSGSVNWVKRAVSDRRCRRCKAIFTMHAAKELRFKLVPRLDGAGKRVSPCDALPAYGAVTSTVVVPCPNCDHVHVFAGQDVNGASMKRAVGWLIDRARPCLHPLGGRFIDQDELKQGYEGNPALRSPHLQVPPEDDNELPIGDGPSGVAVEDDPSAAAGRGHDKSSTGKKHPHAGRRLASPSVRTCCPPTPITGRTLDKAHAILRAHRFDRNAPTFKHLMRKFGIPPTPGPRNPRKQDES